MRCQCCHLYQTEGRNSNSGRQQCWGRKTFSDNINVIICHSRCLDVRIMCSRVGASRRNVGPR